MGSVQSQVLSTLKKMVLPTMSGMVVTFLFQLVDTFFIGQLGMEQLAAVGFTYPLYFGVVSLFMGLTTGVGAAVGQTFGKKDEQGVKESTSLSILLTVVLSLGMSWLLLQVRHPLYGLLGASTNLVPYIDEYMVIILTGMPLLLITLTSIAGLRATGNALVPELMMAFGGLVNLVLDYVLIFGVGPFPAMGIAGAALATAISWGVVLVSVGLLMVYKKQWTLRIPLNHLLRWSKLIFQVALPAMGVQVILPLATAFITRYVSMSGPEAVAAFGIATKIETLGSTLILAMGVVLVPVAATHYGAKEQAHLEAVVAQSGKISTYWSLVLYGLLLVFANPIARIFTQAPQVVAHTALYLRIVGASYPLMGIALITNALFNGVDQPLSALKITLVKYVAILIPALLIGARAGTPGIWIALAITHVLGGLVAARSFTRWLWSQKSAIADVSLLEEYGNDLKRFVGKLRR